ncbi:hypothetical protein GDO81_026131 [Engystomops pustulosus]|uniref:exodeoxyribonuclease III n=1 Tax=Engystomops pustulosus TaxID=76066 RepID=A0AAV6ZMK0_ENGPU|nr:hypothetical protein GDO81_026131 [Engystomops pustulosus]
MVQLLTLNVKGLNSARKRRLALNELKRSRADVQETHYDATGNFNFAKHLYPVSYMASTENKKAGVAILFSTSCPIVPEIVTSDPMGRFIIVQGKMFGSPVLLCNIYAPNSSQVRFITKVLNKLAKPAPLVIGGDFNVIFFRKYGSAGN